MIAEKQKLIRKLKRPKNRSRKPRQPLKSGNELQIAEQSKINQDLIKPKPQQIEDDFDLPPMKFMNIPLKEVTQMTEQERLNLKKQYPNLASYIFMSQRQKSKFFHEKNLKYRKEMETSGNLPARKIQFKRKFQVKIFDQTESASKVKNLKSKKQKYSPKMHYG